MKPEEMSESGFIGLTDEQDLKTSKKKILKSSNLENPYSDNKYRYRKFNFGTNMKNNWAEKSLGEMTIDETPITYGVVKPGPEGDIKFIRGGDLQNGIVLTKQLRTITNEVSNQYQRTLLHGGELLICLVGMPGQTGIAPSELAGANIARQVGLIRLRKEYDVSFYSYYLRSPVGVEKLGLEESGAVQRVINLWALKTVKVPIPPLPEQQRIVSILDEAFAAIAKAKANAEQNLKNAKDLFESYLQGVFENGNWETKTLNEISENLDSKRVPITKNVRNEGSIPYYGASGIVDYVAEYLFDEDLLCVSEDGANLLARTYPIAFSITGKTWVNNHAHVLRFKNMASQKFVELYLNSIKLDDFVSGMAQPKLNQTMLNKIPIPFPSIKEQENIVNKLNGLNNKTKKLEAIYQKKINDLEELKKSVLQKAFSGELKTAKELTV